MPCARLGVFQAPETKEGLGKATQALQRIYDLIVLGLGRRTYQIHSIHSLIRSNLYQRPLMLHSQLLNERHENTARGISVVYRLIPLVKGRRQEINVANPIS